MRWLRNQVIAPLTEELVFRACMLPMLAPCTGLGPAVFTCPLFFGVGEFVVPGPVEMVLAGNQEWEMGARGGHVQQAGRSVTWFSSSSQPIFTTFLSSFVSARAVWGASFCLQVSPRELAWGSPGLGV